MAIDLNIVPDEGDGEPLPDLNADPTDQQGDQIHPLHTVQQHQDHLQQEAEAHRSHEGLFHYHQEDEQVAVHVIDLNIDACEGEQEQPHEGKSFFYCITTTSIR